MTTIDYLLYEGVDDYPTNAAKLKRLLDMAVLVDHPPEAGEVEKAARRLFRYLPPAPNAAIAARLIVGFSSAAGVIQPAFLQNNGPLEFVHFSRPLVALQLLVRAIDPFRIGQGHHSVCGVVAFLQGVAMLDPVGYARYVMDLATTRDGTLSTAGGAALNVHIRKKSNILRKHHHQGSIPEADYIAAASLRDSSNILPYRAWWTNMMLEGATTSASIRGWMQSAGFTFIEDHDHGGEPFWAQRPGADARVFQNLNKARTQVLAGRTVIMSMTRGGRLAQLALRLPTTGGLFEDLFMGHAVLLRGVQFDAIPPGGTHPSWVTLDLVSWQQRSPANTPQIDWGEIMSCYRGFVSGLA